MTQNASQKPPDSLKNLYSVIINFCLQVSIRVNLALPMGLSLAPIENSSPFSNSPIKIAEIKQHTLY